MSLNRNIVSAVVRTLKTLDCRAAVDKLYTLTNQPIDKIMAWYMDPQNRGTGHNAHLFRLVTIAAKCYGRTVPHTFSNLTIRNIAGATPAEANSIIANNICDVDNAKYILSTLMDKKRKT